MRRSRRRETSPVLLSHDKLHQLYDPEGTSRLCRGPNLNPEYSILLLECRLLVVMRRHWVRDKTTRYQGHSLHYNHCHSHACQPRRLHSRHAVTFHPKGILVACSRTLVHTVRMEHITRHRLPASSSATPACHDTTPMTSTSFRQTSTETHTPRT